MTDGPDLVDAVEAVTGHHYVSVSTGRQRGLLAGPYDTHQEALDRVDHVRRIARDVAPDEAAFAAFGTARMASTDNPPAGRLNRYLERDG